MKATIRGTLRSLARLLRYARGDRLRFAAGLLLSASDNMIVNGMFGMLLMAIFSGIEGEGGSAFGRIAVVAGAGAALMALSMLLGGWLFRRAGTRSVARLRQDLMDHALSLPSAWLDGRHSGDVLSRMTADMQTAEQAFGWNLLFPARALISGAGAVIMMVVLDWRFALVASGLGLLSVWVLARFAAPIKRVSDAIQAGVGKISEGASDLLAAAAVLRIFNLGKWAFGRMEGASRGTYRDAMKRTRLQTGQEAVNALTGWSMFVGLLVLGSVAVIYGLIPFSKLIGLVQFNASLFFMFQCIGGAFAQLQVSLAGANRVLELIDAEKEPEPCRAEQPVPGSPAIELDDVSFSYGDGELLSGLTQTVNRGETVALVGGSGGGKSTVLKLLMGFYPAHSGRISLFGHRMGENRASLRHLIAYVPQTCYLFSGTIRDNIAAGRPGATDAEIEAAAAAAMAHEFILGLPQGYATEVGERGAQLSGGQRQRIAIARAILKDAPLLLLDEATASLDSQSETQVQSALERLMAGRTVVVVAHRLSTVRNADRILVLEGGRIVEQGTHDELLSRNGRYAEYYRMQFEGFGEKTAAM